MFPGHPDDAPAAGNLVLDALLGARIVCAGDVDHDGLIATTATVAAPPGHDLVPHRPGPGRALAGLAVAVADGTIRVGHRPVLLHSGGLPGLFGHPRALARAAASGPGFPALPL